MAMTVPGRRSARRPAWIVAAPFLLPYLVLFSIFLVWPLAYGFYISLHDWHLLAHSRPFVGLANYAAVWQDDLFLLALRNTAYFVAIAVPAGNIVSLLIALGLNARVRGETLFRLLYYLPTILSVAVVAVLWKWLYSTEFGLINHYLGRQIPWITDPKLAMPSLAIASIWWGAGGGMLIYLAGLRAIPESYYEAAEIDGAGTWTRFRSITWPLLMPTTLFNLVVGLIGGFQMFGQAFMITGGGPHNATLTVVQYMYRTGFSLFKMGYGAAVAYSLFLVVLAVALLQFRLLAFKEENA
jgi:multiple sugar transport system permease protein